MNTLMLASRLCSKLSVRNVSALVAEDAVTLLDAINGGLKEWFEGLPPKSKQTRVSETVRPPVAIDLSVIDGAKGFSYVSPPFPIGGYADESQLIGKSLTIGGSSIVNRLDASSTLLKPYFGSGGDVTATFYGDAIGFSETSVRIATTPVWEGEGSAACQHDLLPLTCSHQDLLLRDFHSGIPRYYWAGSHRPTDRSAPIWMLRLWPLPSTRGTVTFTLETVPPAFTLDALQVPHEVPLPEHDVMDLIPLCEERLAGTLLWSEKADKRSAYASAERSRQRLRDMSIPLDPRPVHIPTPAHW